MLTMAKLADEMQLWREADNDQNCQQLHQVIYRDPVFLKS